MRQFQIHPQCRILHQKIQRWTESTGRMSHNFPLEKCSDGTPLSHLYSTILFQRNCCSPTYRNPNPPHFSASLSNHYHSAVQNSESNLPRNHRPDKKKLNYHPFLKYESKMGAIADNLPHYTNVHLLSQKHIVIVPKLQQYKLPPFATLKKRSFSFVSHRPQRNKGSKNSKKAPW